MQVSVGALFLGGAITGLMIAVALMVTVYAFAKVRNYSVTASPNWPEFWPAWKGAALALLTPVFVIGGIVGELVTPTESAIIAAGYALILGMFVYRTVTPKDFGSFSIIRHASLLFLWLRFELPLLLVGFCHSIMHHV